MSSRAHTGPWSPLDASLRAYYQGPGTQSDSNPNPQPAPRPQTARRPQPARQNPQPGASSYSCNRFERFENRPVTRSWAKKLSDIEDQTNVLLLLQFEKGNEAIDAFNRQCRRLGLYRKTDEMGSLERAAVDSAMVEGWKEFLEHWVEAGRLQAEEELRRQRQQQQQQRAGQRRAGRSQPRRQKTPVGPRSKVPETNPSASSPPNGPSGNQQPNAGPPAPGSQPTSSNPPRGQSSSSSKTANAAPSGQGAQSQSPAHTSPTRGGSSNKQAKAGPSTQQGQSQNATSPSSTSSKPTNTAKAGSSAQQAQSRTQAKPASAKPAQTAPMTDLQRCRQRVVDAQKDLAEKTRALRSAKMPPITVSQNVMTEISDAHMWAQHEFSQAQFAEDNARRRAAAAAMPGDFADNYAALSSVAKSEWVIPEEVAAGKTVDTGPSSDPQELHQRVVDAQKKLDDCKREYQETVKPPNRPPLAVVNQLRLACERAQDELANVLMDKENGQRARVAEANRLRTAGEEEEAMRAKVARQRQREESRSTATTKITPQTQSSTANTTPAAPKTSPTIGPSFLAKLKADNEAARLASAELQKKREAEAAANPTTQKRRRPLEGDLFLNLMKQKQKGKGPEDKKATVEEVPDSAREEKIGKGNEREGADLRERIGPSPTVPKVDEEDLYSGA